MMNTSWDESEGTCTVFLLQCHLIFKVTVQCIDNIFLVKDEML